MKKNLFIVCLLLAFTACTDPTKKAETTTPESLGVSSQSILNFIEAAEKTRPDDLHSFILMRHGQVAAQGWWNPYNPDSPHMLFSLSKSFTSTAIGIAQSEGLLSINDKVISFFPDETPASPSENLQSMRIRDLLKMNSGHNEDATGRMRNNSESWVKGFLALNVEHKPGTHFVYNSAATFMLSAIIQKVTGKTLLEYLTPRLFVPLGIDNPTWETSPEGINTGGWGLKVRTKDIASLGQLYVQKGHWQGKQILPEAWVAEATSLQTSNGSNPDSDWEQGYGYQFWRCRHNLYRGDGAFGQYCIVFPEQDAVLAITSGTSDMGAIMNLVWDNILPGLTDKPLEENKDAWNALQTKLSSLSLSVVKGEASSTLAPEVTKQVYQLKPNKEGFTEMVLNLDEGNLSLSLAKGENPFVVPFETGKLKTSLPDPPGKTEPAASSGAWISPDTLQIRTYLFETPFYNTYTIVFDKDEVILTMKSNVSFGPAAVWELKGSKK
jgi:CubicO group peptidase (beta-lactamase class C family)